MKTYLLEGTVMAFETCISCGCSFAMPEELNDEYRRTHVSF